MTAADLTAATGGATFQDGIAGFERVTVGLTQTGDGVGAVTNTVDLANLDNINYVSVQGVEADTGTAGVSATGDLGTLNINNLAANATVNITSAILDSTIDTDTATLNIALADATGSSDVLNLAMTAATAITNTGTVVANNIETINITADDTAATPAATHTLILSTDSATTINVTGDAGLNLTDTDTNITLIDATNMTGALTATASNASEMIKGGSGNDVLTATGSQVTLLGGDGNDTLTGGDLTTLTGGAGDDTFVMNTPTNVNSYSTITDLSSNDIIDLDTGDTGNVQFIASAITLAPTAVFQDYANAAVNALGADLNDAAWFQYNGNTYIVKSGANHTSAATPDFQSGVDGIIQITGLVDLSTASYNQSIGTLDIA